MSLPTRERGLKLYTVIFYPVHLGVAPYTGAWIETFDNLEEAITCCGRSLHGSVD